MMRRSELWGALRTVHTLDELERLPRGTDPEGLQVYGVRESDRHRVLFEAFMDCDRSLWSLCQRVPGALWSDWSEAARIVWMLGELGMDRGELLAQHPGKLWPEPTADHAKARSEHLHKQQDMVREAVKAAVGSFNLALLGLD